MEEHLLCPICKDVPHSEVFQCRSGHLICSLCIAQCVSCPTCRLPYETPRIRNRVLENILDTMEFECPRKNKGCPLKLRRGQIERHSAAECLFRPFNFCNHLGFEKCSFVVDPKAPALLAIKHLQTAHNVSVRQGSCLEISHENFLFAVNAKCYKQNLGVPFNSSFCWPPVIVQVDKDVYGTTLIILCVSNAEQCCWIPLLMGDSQAEAEKFQVEFSLPNLFGAFGLESVFKWRVTPVPFKKVEDVFKAPSFSLPLTFLRNQVTHVNGSITLKIQIYQKTPPENPVQLSVFKEI